MLSICKGCRHAYMLFRVIMSGEEIGYCDMNVTPSGNCIFYEPRRVY